jgi:hypothetical protein
MMRLAGRLLILTGILLLLAFLFQIPYMYQLVTGSPKGGGVVIAILWRLGLVAASVLLIRSGRRMR